MKAITTVTVEVAKKYIRRRTPTPKLISELEQAALNFRAALAEAKNNLERAQFRVGVLQGALRRIEKRLESVRG